MISALSRVNVTFSCCRLNLSNITGSYSWASYMFICEPVGFFKYVPVICACLSQLDMDKWASGMWTFEPVVFMKYEPVICASLSHLHIDIWARKMWLNEPVGCHNSAYHWLLHMSQFCVSIWASSIHYVWADSICKAKPKYSFNPREVPYTSFLVHTTGSRT